MNVVALAVVALAAAIVVAAVLVSRALSRAAASLGEHLAGAFGTSEDYEKAYVPWDELMSHLVDRDPEQWGPQELVFEDQLS